MRARAFVVLVPLALTWCGCGGPPDAVQATLSTTSRALNQVDAEVAREYSDVGRRCLAASSSMETYRECVAAFDDIEQALRTTHASLLTAQAAADAWEDGSADDGPWHAAVPCLAEALSWLTQTLAAAGMDVPAAVGSALWLAERVVGVCRD